MKKFLVAALGVMVVLAFTAPAAVLAGPAQVTAFGLPAGWQNDPAVTALKGGNGNATGPKDGTGNQNGLRKGGGTGTCPNQTAVQSTDPALQELRGGYGNATGPKDGTGYKKGARNGGGTGTCPNQ